MGYFFIDGYNLLFQWSEEDKPLQIRRTHLIGWIQQTFQEISCKGTIVFDGAHRRDEEYGLSYPSPMEVAFAPKGQTADQYIIEQIELAENKKTIVVVTNDRNLKNHVSFAGASTMSIQAFLQWLMKKKAKKRSKKLAIKESPAQIERLVKIFEERLKNDQEE